MKIIKRIINSDKTLYVAKGVNIGLAIAIIIITIKDKVNSEDRA